MSFCSWAKQEIYRDNFSPGDYVCRFVKVLEYEPAPFPKRFLTFWSFLWIWTFYLAANATTRYSPGKATRNKSEFQIFTLSRFKICQDIQFIWIVLWKASRSMSITHPGRHSRTRFTRILFPRSNYQILFSNSFPFAFLSFYYCKTNRHP